MNILYATCYLDVSGVTKLNYDILSRLSFESKIHICTTSDDSKLPDNWDSRFSTTFLKPLKLCYLAPGERYPVLLKYIQQHHIEIIYITHSVWMYEHLARLKRDLPKLRIVDSLHVLEPYCVRGGYPDISANRFVHPYIDASILISRNLEEYILRNYQVDRGKLHVIPNGIDITSFQTASECPTSTVSSFFPDAPCKVIGFIGRFSDQKRPLFFMEIICDLIKINLDLRFYMVGNGPLLNQISIHIKKLGLDDKVSLLPSGSDIALLLRETNVLVLPSSYEGGPLTILEALAAGVQVVASDVGAVREYVGDNCRLIKLGNADQQERRLYVRAVEESLADGRYSGELAPEHNIKIVVESYQKVFLNVLGPVTK